MKINKSSIISTKKGDKGYSRNYSNDSLPKDDVLFSLLGSIDELSSSLGIAYHYTDNKELIQNIQLKLQHINSLIATNIDDPRRERLEQITTKTVTELEEISDKLLKENPLEPVFLLPGSSTSKAGAYLDLSRSITRRCERELVKFVNEKQRDDLTEVAAYINRLSDLLFVLARK